MLRLLSLLATIVMATVLLVAPGGADGAASPTLLRLDGIGPLKLGMARTDAVKTGWLSNRTTGCPLGGTPLPVVYRLKGAAAPAGVRGFATFDRGRLTNLALDRGVRTAAGVTVGTTSLTQMAVRYRSRGYRVQTEASDVFGGTFVTVTKGTKSVIAGFGSGRIVTTLGLPFVAVCD